MTTRYVLISTDITDKVIKGGPILWDGSSLYTATSGHMTLSESDALAQGYMYPPQPKAVINEGALRVKAMAALNTNLAYLAITGPTQAQAIAQIAMLTRQVNAIIRLTQGLLDVTDGS